MPRFLPTLRAAWPLAMALAAACLATRPAAAVPPFTLDLVDSNPAGSVGEYSSMRVDHLGHPHVAYYDDVNGNLKYAFHNGTSWVVQTADPTTDDVGEFCSLALDSLDRPHIAYHDATHGRLMYTTKVGATWTREVADTATFDCGWYTSIAIDRSGQPWIASYDRGIGNPRVSQRVNGVGWVGTYLDSTFNLSGFYAQIVIDAGNTPHVCWYDLTDHKLVYATRRLNADHNQVVWVQETADSSAHDVGLFCSLRVDSFHRVHIAYMDLTTADLVWALRDPTSGRWTHQAVDNSPDDVGYDCSLALDPIGYPNISYHDGTTGTLRLARQDVTGWHLQTVDDSPGFVGLYSSLGTDAQGNFRISYWDGTAHTLKFAWGPTSTLLDAPPVAELVTRFTLSPNPARAGQRVRLSAPDAGAASVEILDIAGRRVAALQLGGDHAAEWDPAAATGGAVPPGVYLARALRADGTRAASTRLVVVR